MPEPIPTRLPGVTLRFAVEDDVELVQRLIVELAEYEKLAHEVTGDVDTLRRSLFGERRVAEVVIAEHDGEAAGFALFFHNFSTFLGQQGIYLEDLYVREAHRGGGIGRLLLGWLAALARERGCGRLEWWVLDWNEPAIGFYRGLGARPMDEWTVYRVTGETLEELAATF